MENATKALLIAAAVLIAIVLIATGVLLIKNISGTSQQANETGELLSNATDKASSDIIGGLKRTIISKEKFNDFINNFNQKYSNSKEFIDTINIQNEKLKDQIEIMGYIYVDTTKRFYEADVIKDYYTKNNYHEYMMQEGFKILENKNIIERLENPLSDSHRGELLEVYAKMKGETLTDENKETIEAEYIKDKNDGTIVSWITWYFGYDKYGYIDRAYYIVFLDCPKSWYK